MDEKNTTVDKPSAETAKVENPTIETQVDDAYVTSLQNRIKDVEVERDNYKTGLLKLKNKQISEGSLTPEDDEERLRLIAREELASSSLGRMIGEKDELLQKTLKENKELKLAQLNKPPIPSSTGSHSEAPGVVDTSITPEQLTAFKAKGWTDKDIERYKQNLKKKI